MQYLPLFLLLLAVLIAAWFYLQRTKLRGVDTTPATRVDTTSAERVDTPAEPTSTATAAPSDRPD